MIGSRTSSSSLPLVLAALAAVLACSSKDDEAGGDCGLVVGGKEYRLMTACDSTFGQSVSVRLCTEYYSNVEAVKPSFDQLCVATQGKAVERCPTENSLGSCTNTSTNGGGLGAISVIFEYEGGSRQSSSFATQCEGTYSPPGAPPASTASANATVSSTCPAPAQSTGSGVAFSVSTLVNGEVISCTNFSGSVTPEELASVLNIGATTSPCPAERALCSCDMPGAGTFGTDATIVYYQTRMQSSESVCDSIRDGCVSGFSDSYEEP